MKPTIVTTQYTKPTHLHSHLLLPPHRQTQQKQKRVQATAPVHRRPDRKQRGQFSVYSTTTTLRTDRRAADNSSLAKWRVQC